MAAFTTDTKTGERIEVDPALQPAARPWLARTGNNVVDSLFFDDELEMPEVEKGLFGAMKGGR